MPAIAAGLYLLITIGALLPATFKHPIRVTAENRPCLEALSRQMLAWFKLDMVCLFAWIQWNIVGAMRIERFTMSPATVPAFLVVILGTTGWYIASMIRAGRPRSNSWIRSSFCQCRLPRERLRTPKGSPATAEWRRL